MPTYAEPSNDNFECSPNAEPSGMKDDGKSQDNGSATIMVLFRTTKILPEEISQKAKKKKKRERERKTPIYKNCDKLNL